MKNRINEIELCTTSINYSTRLRISDLERRVCGLVNFDLLSTKNTIIFFYGSIDINVGHDDGCRSHYM